MEKSPDDSWFQDIYDHYRRQIFGRCFSFMHNQEDAADLTQDTFLRAFASPEFPAMAPDHKRNWLFNIARNLCLSKLRRPQKVVLWGSDDPMPDPVDPRPTPDDLVVWGELAQKLEFLAKEERYAAVARACGLTLKEIGEARGYSIATASTHYQKAIAKLKRLYEDDKRQ